MKASFAVATLALVLSSGIAFSEEPFDLRGIKLGITIAAFRNVPYPDQEKYQGVRVICTPDREQNKLLVISWLDPPVKLKTIGVNMCNFFKTTTAPFGMDFAGVCECIVQFYFSPQNISPDKQSRLYQIGTRLPSGHFGDVVAAFTAKYGKSRDTERTAVKNRMGAEFANETVTWKNDVSSITIERYSGSLDTMSINYFHSNIAVSLNGALDALSKKGADKL